MPKQRIPWRTPNQWREIQGFDAWMAMWDRLGWQIVRDWADRHTTRITTEDGDVLWERGQ